MSKEKKEKEEIRTSFLGGNHVVHRERSMHVQFPGRVAIMYYANEKLPRIYIKKVSNFQPLPRN